MSMHATRLPSLGLTANRSPASRSLPSRCTPMIGELHTPPVTGTSPLPSMAELVGRSCLLPVASNGALPKDTVIEALELVRIPTPDLKITSRNGKSVYINLAAHVTGQVNQPGAVNLGDVRDRIQDQAKAAGLDLVVTIDGPQRRLRVTDSSQGTGQFVIESTVGSTAASDLGLAGKRVYGSVIIGDALAVNGGGNLTPAALLDNSAAGAIQVTINDELQDILLVGTTHGVHQAYGLVNDVTGTPTIRSSTPGKTTLPANGLNLGVVEVRTKQPTSTYDGVRVSYNVGAAAAGMENRPVGSRGENARLHDSCDEYGCSSCRRIR